MTLGMRFTRIACLAWDMFKHEINTFRRDITCSKQDKSRWAPLLISCLKLKAQKRKEHLNMILNS